MIKLILFFNQLQKMTGSVDKLLKAKQVFERFRTNMIDDRDQAGAVLAFGYCYEIVWKMMQKILKLRGLEAGSPRDTFRKAVLEKLIDDPETWFEFQRKRNITVHTYQQENLDAIVAIFDDFSRELENLIQNIKTILQE